MNYNFCTFLKKPQRVDIFVSTLFEDFSRSYVQKIIDRGQITVNGTTISKNLKISNKDEINITIKLEKIWVESENMNLDIIFEDDEIIILNKNSKINVHPVPGEWWNSGTLVNGVLYHCKDNLPSIWWVERPGIVHRLDKDTTWAIMIAKSDKMMKYLSNITKERKIDKYYLAIVQGKVKNKHFKIESIIGRHKDDRTKMTTISPINGKEAITYGEVIDFIDNKYSFSGSLDNGNRNSNLQIENLWWYTLFQIKSDIDFEKPEQKYQIWKKIWNKNVLIQSSEIK